MRIKEPETLHQLVVETRKEKASAKARKRIKQQPAEKTSKPSEKAKLLPAPQEDLTCNCDCVKAETPEKTIYIDDATKLLMQPAEVKIPIEKVKTMKKNINLQATMRK